MYIVENLCVGGGYVRYVTQSELSLHRRLLLNTEDSDGQRAACEYEETEVTSEMQWVVGIILSIKWIQRLFCTACNFLHTNIEVCTTYTHKFTSVQRSCSRIDHHPGYSVRPLCFTTERRS